MQNRKSRSKISCEIRCMDPASAEDATARLDPTGVEWISYTCQLSGEKEAVLLIGEQVASRLVKVLPEAKDTKDSKILAGLYSAELCECDVATLTALSDDEVVSRLKLFTGLGVLAHREVHGMNYYHLDSESARRAIKDAVQTTTQA